MNSKTKAKADLWNGVLPYPFVDAMFEDDIWPTEVPAVDAQRNLKWNTIRLHDGSRLTAHRNRELLNGAKTYLLLIAKGTAGTRTLRGGTLHGRFSDLRALIEWMSSRRLKSFRDLSLSHAIGYRNFVQRRNARNSRGRDKARSRKLASRSQQSCLTVITRLATLQHHMGERGTCFSRAEAVELADYLKIDVQTEAPILPIPDESFAKLLESAVQWLLDEAPKVLLLKSAYDVYHAKFANRKLTQRSRRAYERVAADILPAEATIRFGGIERSLTSLYHADCQRLLSLTRGACFVVIAALIGMRVSEILSLRRGCLTTRTIGAGLKVLVLKGTLFKTSRAAHGERAEWVAGYDEPGNPIRVAIEVLERLPRGAGVSGLFAPLYRQPGPKKERVGTQAISKKGLQAFAKERGVIGWHFTAHQFRKTFARFVALSSVASIFILMRHFKHQRVLMTEHYMKCDPELLNEIYECSMSIITERLDSVFGAERLGGIAGQRIIANNEPYRGEANAGARRKLIDITIHDPNARFRPTPYGLCIYDEDLASCRGDINNVGLDTCVTCPNFVVEQPNLAFWLDEVTILEATIAEQAAFGIVNIDLHRKLQQAKSIVSSLIDEENRGSSTPA